MADINFEYLKRQGPTNVLAFPMAEGKFKQINPQILGDVVLCTDVAAKEAQKAKISLETRLFELLIHGIAHLTGYDHADELEAAQMQKKEAELFEIIINEKAIATCR